MGDGRNFLKSHRASLFNALGISPEVQVHVEHNEKLQLAGQSSVVEWSDVEQIYRHKRSYITEAGISKN